MHDWVIDLSTGSNKVHFFYLSVHIKFNIFQNAIHLYMLSWRFTGNLFIQVTAHKCTPTQASQAPHFQYTAKNTNFSTHSTRCI